LFFPLCKEDPNKFCHKNNEAQTQPQSAQWSSLVAFDVKVAVDSMNVVEETVESYFTVPVQSSIQSALRRSATVPFVGNLR
jgi:hypothetical protein